MRDGVVEFDAENLDAPAVSEVEVRSADLADVIGEQENLLVGLSGHFSATLSSDRYVVDCPGTATSRWTLVTTGRSRAR